MGADGLSPSLGREVGDLAVRMGRDPQEDVLQVREGWDVDEFAALDQGVQQGGPPRGRQAAREEPVLPAMPSSA